MPSVVQSHLLQVAPVAVELCHPTFKSHFIFLFLGILLGTRGDGNLGDVKSLLGGRSLILGDCDRGRISPTSCG